MTEAYSESISERLTLQSYPDITKEVFGRYQEEMRIRKETTTGLKRLWETIKDKISSSTALDKPRNSYDELRLSTFAKIYLDTHQDILAKENPDTSVIVLYLPGDTTETTEVTRLSLPRLNEKNIPIIIPPFTLIPTPKSNGYNTEYSITDDAGNIWTQLAILYPAENPTFLKKKKIRDEVDALFKSRILLHAAELAITARRNKEKKVTQSKIAVLDSKIQELRTQIIEIGNPTQYTHFSYIPYRKGLDTRENQMIGYEYLASTIKKMYEHNIGSTTIGNSPSNAVGLSINDAIPWQFPLILNLVERMDYEQYYESKGKILQSPLLYNTLMSAQISQSLTTFGINGSSAFNWQRSRVGAQGVGQIMPTTYSLFQNHSKYKEFLGNTDFEEASRDHESSFRLQVAHLDDQIGQFPPTIRNNWTLFMEDKSMSIEIFSLLAAGYNGSMKRIVNEVFGDIMSSPVTDQKKLLDLYKERLTSRNILKAMEQAKDRDIANIYAKYKPAPIRDGRTKKLIQPKDSPPAKEQLEAIRARTATYRESMTYVLKSEYVWKYLKEQYKDKF